MKSWGVFVAFSVSLVLSSLFLTLSVEAQTFCNTCTSCNLELSTASSGDVIMISNTDNMDDFDGNGNCIIHDTGPDGLVLDCNNNVITGSSSGTGISTSKILDIANCIVTEFNNGISLAAGSDTSSITNSSVSYNTNGIQIASDDNEINDTIIMDNTNGINISSGVGGNILYNNRLENTNNVVFDTPQTNYWSTSKTLGTSIIGGPYIGGNYWSDYVPTTDNDDDGIGDTPHTIAASNSDSLPLVYDIFPPEISYVEPPTPANGSILYVSTVTIKVTSNEILNRCIFDWDGTNYTVSTSDENCTRSFTVSTSGLYHYRVYAEDTDGNMNVTYGDESIYREVTFDLDELVVFFVSPTPQNNNYTSTDSYTINVSSGDDSNLASCILTWNGVNESVTPSGSYCQRTKSSLPDGPYTFRMYATDTNGRNASTATRTATVDTVLDIAYDPATPANDSTISYDWVYVRVNSDISLQECNLTLNGIDEAMTVSGTSCYINRTGLVLTEYTFNVSVLDATGKQNTTETRTFRIDTGGPVISLHTVTPTNPVVGDNITLNMSATDSDGVDELWVIVTKPDETTERVDMANGVAENYTIALGGDYTITFYANDTVGSQSSYAQQIYARSFISFSSNIEFGNETFPSSMDVYLPGTTSLVESYTSSTGVFSSEEIIEGVYDIYFQSFDDNLLLKLMGVDISTNNDNTIRLDYIDPPASGFAYTYAIESPYTISSAVIRIYYDEDDDAFASEEGLELYRCAQWNFTGRECTGSWSKINHTLSTSGDYIEANLTSFSGFSVNQGSYCGNGVCESGETPTNCSSDCTCIPGDIRLCAVAHSGLCAQGTESCNSLGEWSGCPPPGIEACNGVDDNCDGIIDNIGGQTSIFATKCGCYGGEYATPETCNGIDDDCDGQIDDGSDCCASGDKKQCGTSLTEGICRPGTSMCTNGVWGSCIDAVTPMSEICGNNLDDDCDGQIDDGCANYSLCSEGVVSTVCICGGEITDYGYCCNGEIYIDGCPSLSGWWILVAIGIMVLIVLYLLVTYFKSQGKELTWEALSSKYRVKTPEEREAEYYSKRLSSEEEMKRFESGKQDLEEQPNVFDELEKKKKK